MRIWKGEGLDDAILVRVWQARQATTNTFFSRKEVGSRGDTSDWTDTPEEKAKKAQQM